MDKLQSKNRFSQGSAGAITRFPEKFDFLVSAGNR